MVYINIHYRYLEYSYYHLPIGWFAWGNPAIDQPSPFWMVKLPSVQESNMGLWVDLKMGHPGTQIPTVNPNYPYVFWPVGGIPPCSDPNNYHIKLLPYESMFQSEASLKCKYPIWMVYTETIPSRNG